MASGPGPLPPYLEWTRSHGSSSTDEALDIAVDELHRVFVAGGTGGNLVGTSYGQNDAFLSRYDADGNRIWTTQWGSAKWDSAYGVDVDAAGGVYIAGAANGFWGGVDRETAQAFVNKFDVNGGLEWTRQFGSSTTDEGRDLTVDGLGNVFITGFTLGDLQGTSFGKADGFIRKYNALGDPLWTRQFGSSEHDVPTSAATDDEGNVYVAGSTGGALGGPFRGGIEDAFLAKFDAAGNQLWIRQLGSASQNFAQDVSVDELGNVFVAGVTTGEMAAPSAGAYDGWLANYDAAGNELWTRQFGGVSYDSANAVAADGFGNVYVNGASNSNLPGTDADGGDSYLMKFDSAGNSLWTTAAGPAGSDAGYAVATDGAGAVYTGGILFTGGGPFDYDTFLAKVQTVPEPAGFALALMAIAACRGAGHTIATRGRRLRP